MRAAAIRDVVRTVHRSANVTYYKFTLPADEWRLLLQRLPCRPGADADSVCRGLHQRIEAMLRASILYLFVDYMERAVLLSCVGEQRSATCVLDDHVYAELPRRRGRGQQMGTDNES